MILKKSLFTTFYVTTSCFSRIRFEIVPFTPKRVNYSASDLFTTCYATQQVDETFVVTVKTMSDFVCRLNGKARKSISHLYTCTYLTPLVTTPITSYFPFNML